MIAVAGSTKSFVIYVTGGTSYTAIEVTSNGSVPAIDVAATNDIVVFLGSSSKATVVDLTKNIRYQSPAQVSLGGNFT